MTFKSLSFSFSLPTGTHQPRYNQLLSTKCLNIYQGTLVFLFLNPFHPSFSTCGAAGRLDVVNCPFTLLLDLSMEKPLRKSLQWPERITKNHEILLIINKWDHLQGFVYSCDPGKREANCRKTERHACPMNKRCGHFWFFFSWQEPRTNPKLLPPNK